MSFNLIKFELHRQVKSSIFILISLVLIVFTLTQFKEVMLIPINSEVDILKLESSGYHEFLYVEKSDEQLKTETITFLKKQIESNNLTDVEDLNSIISILENEQYAFDQIQSEVDTNSRGSSYLEYAQSQFGYRLGDVEEVNENLQKYDYSKELQHLFITYIQVIIVFLLFPIIMFTFVTDYSHNMFEIVYFNSNSASKYLITKFLGVLSCILFIIYVIGFVLNLVSFLNFKINGFDVGYNIFLIDYLIYIVPAILFFASLLLLLLMFTKKVSITFPIYIAYALFNVTPNAFSMNDNFVKLVNPIIRLDWVSPNIFQLAISRLIYILISILLIMLSNKVYKKMRNDIGKELTI